MRFLWLCSMLAALPPSAMAQTLAPVTGAVHDAARMNPKMESFFRALQRPDTPNHWLVAPVDFAVRPDAAAPVFAFPAAAVHAALRMVIRQTKGAVIHGETADGLHVVVTSAIFGFKDDVRVHVIPLSSQQSTLAIYSASRVGYWDLGANRRRVEDWLVRLPIALSAPKP